MKRQREETPKETEKKVKKEEILKKIVVTGNPKIKFNKNILEADDDIIMEIEGTTITVKSDAENSGNIIISNGNFSNFNNSGGYISSNGISISDNKIQLKSLGNRKIVIGGRDITKEVQKILDSKEIIKVKEEGIKIYDMSKYDIIIEKITTSGQSSIELNPEIISKKKLSVSSCGQSNIDISDLQCKSGDIHCAGQSRFGGDVMFDTCEISTSGQSSVSDILCKDELDANSSGQSSINVKVSKGCSVSKDKSGQSTIKITKME